MHDARHIEYMKGMQFEQCVQHMQNTWIQAAHAKHMDTSSTAHGMLWVQGMAHKQHGNPAATQARWMWWHHSPMYGIYTT
jgi:hypothetical protein